MDGCARCGSDSHDIDDCEQDDEASEDVEPENPETNNMPVTNPYNGRAFGIEIECNRSVFGSSRDLAEALARKLSTPVARVSYDEQRGDVDYLSNGWGVGYDGSCGWEVKSPLLYGQDGLRAVESVLAAMESIGCRVNTACGIHVHVDMRDVRESPRMLSNVAAMIGHAEDAIFRCVNESRLGNNFCRQFNPNLVALAGASTLEQAQLGWYYGNIDERLTGYAPADRHRVIADYLRNIYSMRTAHFHDTRYQAANFHSVFFRGSLEFRYFNSTLRNRSLVQAWIVLCVALVEYGARATGRVRFPSIGTLMRGGIPRRATSPRGVGRERLSARRFRALLNTLCNGRVLSGAQFPSDAAAVLVRRFNRRAGTGPSAARVQFPLTESVVR